MNPTKFSIQAHTYTPKKILDRDVTYIIPIYQRPYSWKEAQLKKLLSDIFVSFYGYDKNTTPEPLFIGTMQLSGVKENEQSQQVQEIIDGQQRISTLLILLKQLKSIYPNCEQLTELSFNWLKTTVNNGEQQQNLTEYLEQTLPTDSDITSIQNPYQRNACIIQEYLEEELKNEENDFDTFNIQAFAEYLFTNIYFVIIETTAGLSKTLQIFDAINTTGLDLNGSDVFKIRMFEYLKDVQKQDDTVFNSINELYAKVDRYNKNHKCHISFQEILSIYQDLLISKYKLSNILYGLGADTFFERLFDVLLNVNNWDDFTEAKNVVLLNLIEIDTIIEQRFYWFLLPYPTFEDACMTDLLWWSRYGRYWKIIVLFLYRFPTQDEKLFMFINQLSKLYFLYSIYFQRAVGHINTFSYALMKDIVNESDFDTIINKIERKIKEVVPYYSQSGINVCKRVLNENIAYNRRKKDLICRLSAMLDEDYKMKTNFKKLRAQFFHHGEYRNDIEHIQSNNDNNLQLRDKIKNDWGSDLHSIGNLILLERKKNRSIGNKNFIEKREQYLTSAFQTVQLLAENNEQQWTLKDCQNRKISEIKKLTDYLFSIKTNDQETN